jgi:hypothetical protein
MVVHQIVAIPDLDAILLLNFRQHLFQWLPVGIVGCLAHGIDANQHTDAKN